MPSLQLTLSASTGRQYLPRVRKHVLTAHAILRPALTELSIAFVGDRRMSQLHVQFMHIPGPTDVLTFPLDLDEENRPITGEVIVCVPEAVRQAKSHGTQPADELLLYALHGLLHLCGFDDRTEEDFAIMHRQEDLILSRLGVGRVFAPDARAELAHPTEPGRVGPVAAVGATRLRSVGHSPATRSHRPSAARRARGELA